MGRGWPEKKKRVSTGSRGHYTLKRTVAITARFGEEELVRRRSREPKGTRDSAAEKIKKDVITRRGVS